MVVYNINQRKKRRIMKKTISLLILLLICFGKFSQAQEANGIWAGAFEADDVVAALRVNFDESKIALNFSGSEQAGAIRDVKFSGSEVSFTAELRPAGKFIGKISGDKITGTFEIIRSDGTKAGSGIWNARKVDSFDFKAEQKSVSTGQKIELPKPSGKYLIGRKFFYWTDESRAETITEDANDKRKLFVQIWFPAKASKKPAADYYPNAAEIYGADDYAGIVRSLKSHAVQDAEIAKSKTKFPVIIFSPGLGSSPFANTALIENLVSRGYAVAAINHPYDSGDFKFSDGQIIRFDKSKWDREVSKDYTAEQRKKFFDERRLGWAADISFVVGELTKLDKSFREKLDLENLGMLGYSFGGQAATIACASDARFKACANLDGMAQGNVFLPDADGKILKQPFLFFNKAAEVTDTELAIMNLTRQEYRILERKRLTTRWKPSFKKRLAELESGAYFALYPGIKHSSFSDTILIDSKDALFADRFEIAGNINEYVAQFFDKFLLKKSAPRFENKNDSASPVVLEYLKTK